MPPSHRAYAFRYSAFAAELKPKLNARALEGAAAAEALARYYDPGEDLGLGLSWQRFYDTKAVLGRELPGLGYVQSEADVRDAIVRVEPTVPSEGDALLVLLRTVAARGLGLYVVV